MNLILGSIVNTDAKQDYSIKARIADTTLAVDYKVQLRPLLSFKRVQIFRFIGFALAICNGENVGYLVQAELRGFNIFVFLGIILYAFFGFHIFTIRRKN